MGTNDCCCGRLNVAQGTRVIAVASGVISLVAFIAFAVQLARRAELELELPEFDPDVLREYNKRHPPGEPGHINITNADVLETLEFLEHHIRNELIVYGVLTGASLVSLVVAILLFLAVKKNNRFLALPFMVWTILSTVAAGVMGVLLIVAFPAMKEARREGVLTEEGFNQMVVWAMVLPLVFVAILFKLYVWWLVVVFNFYNRLKFSAHEQVFDGIQMQTA